MNKIEVMQPLTGEVLDINKVTPVISIPVSSYDTQANYTPRKDAEHNSGEYIVDDRDYCDLRTLLERCKRVSPRTRLAIEAGAMAQYEGSTMEQIIQSETIPSGEAVGSEVTSNDLSTGNGATVEESAQLNPVDKLPDENS